MPRLNIAAAKPTRSPTTPPPNATTVSLRSILLANIHSTVVWRVFQDLLPSPGSIDNVLVSISASDRDVTNLERCKFSTFLSVIMAINLRLKTPSR